MDEFVLKAKHFQIFISFFIASIIAGIVPNFHEYVLLIKTIFIFIPFLVWVFMLGKSLNRCLPRRKQLDETFQTISLFVSVIAYVILVMMVNGTIHFTGFAVLLPLFIGGCYLYLYYFAAKALVSAEQGSRAVFGDHFGAMILLMFSYVGIWFIQPRVNQLWDQYKEKFD